MGRKRASCYARRVGKKSKGRRGFKGRKVTDAVIEQATVNNYDIVNIVNTPTTGNVNNTETVNKSNVTINNVNSNGNKQGNNTTPKISEVEKAKATAIKRNFRKLSNRSADKINCNNTIYVQQTKERHYRRRLVTNSGYIPSKGYKLIDGTILNQILSEFSRCIKCKSKGLAFEEFAGIQHGRSGKSGLAESVRLSCKNCKYVKHFKTSSYIPKRGYEVNMRAVYASQSIGRAGLVRFCGIMDLPKPLCKKSYNNI